MNYLGNLTLRLAAGATRLSKNFRSRHNRFLLDAQAEDGGFAGREGGGDLYYTGFALRGLALLGGLTLEVASDVARFLGGWMGTKMPSVDFLSLVQSTVILEAAHGIDVFGDCGQDRQSAVADVLRRHRREDGGYAKSARNRPASTYHTFLSVACLQLIGAPVEETQRLVELICRRQRDDGGFVELDPLPQGGTNPTAAAIGLLRMLDALEDRVRDRAIGFLGKMQNAEGGFRANTRIPVADLLSTFTGLVALADLDALDTIDRARASRYAEALEQSQGGYRGGLWDDAADVEYTFYGIGVSALLADVED
jgi:geranylgeranyl transferase type-2 subunit beta